MRKSSLIIITMPSGCDSVYIAGLTALKMELY